MKKQLIISILLVASLFAVLPASVSADTVTVPGDYATIQAAIDNVSDGDVITVAAGTYTENLVIDNPGKSFTLRGAGADVTTLDGNYSGSVIVILSTGASVVTIEGFTIRNGTGDTTNWVSTCGGGIYTNYANVIVRECVFNANQAYYGGGMFNESYENNGTYTNKDYPSYAIVVTSCLFTGNDASFGGGMYNYVTDSVLVTDTTFIGNHADYGGGMYNEGSSGMLCTVAVERCTFDTNYAVSDGGGMENYEITDSVTVKNSLFTGNLTSKDEYCNGGGMHNCDSSPAVTNCRFEYNQAYNGGGMMNGGESAPVVTDCTFVENVSTHNGGGMMNAEYAEPVVTGCTFVENVADKNGGGMMNAYCSAPVVSECIFNGNKSLYDSGGGGGGMMNAYYSAPVVTHCTFMNNWAAYRGGGMYNTSESTPTISHSTFVGNEAIRRGAGMDNHDYAAPVITNCVFVGNTVIGTPYSNDRGADGIVQPMTSAGGGGMMNSYYSTPVITNCTFTQNSVPYYSNGGDYDGENGGGVKFNTSYPSTVTNCIIWGNFCGDNPNDVLDTYGDYALITFSNVGGGWPGDGNIDADPQFVNAPADVSLRAGSPCIDAGTYASLPSLGGVIDDILGVPRPQGSAYDMGAYECAGASWSPVVVQPLARTQLAAVLSLWEELLSRLPDEPTDEMAALIEQIQGHVANAAQLTNPIYASGQLSKAAAAMQQLAALLA